MGSASSTAIGPARDAFGERLAFDQLHHQRELLPGRFHAEDARRCWRD